MTTSYNRSQIISFFELSEEQKQDIRNNYYDELQDAENDSYVMFDEQDGKETALPLGMFMSTNLHTMKASNFTHGIYSTSAFDGYFITLSRRNDECIIARKCF